jgi:ParB-like nuclease family protein
LNKTIAVGLGGIGIKPERLRVLRPESVKEIAASMRAIGQLQPIVIRPNRNETGYWLVAGRHRFEAAKLLKWPSINAVVADGLSADQAALAEIDENLMRADLTPAERALHLSARKPLYEQLHPQTKRGAAGGAATKAKARAGANSQIESQPSLSFVADTANKTGKGRSTVAREVSRGENIDRDVLADVAGTSLDQPGELDALAKLPAKEQRTLAKAVKKGKRVSAKTRVKQLKRKEREQELAQKTAAAASALGQEPPASVIVIDWALRFDVWSEKGEDRSAENHYPCGTVDEMIALKPPMADDVVVFAWTSGNNSRIQCRSWTHGALNTKAIRGGTRKLTAQDIGRNRG